MLRQRTFSLAAFVAAFLFVGARAQTTEKPDLSRTPTLYVVGYAHLDTEWRWEYPQVIDEYLRKTMEENFRLFDKYPHYIFNFSGANRYRLMKEYFPADFARLKSYVDSGRWFPAGSSMEEGDVNAPSAEAIIRQVLYGNNWFRKELGKASAEYMLPDCFGFPASLPTILAHSGVKGFSTQKLVWGSSAPGGGPESLEKTPEGTPFDVGVWVGPDGETVLGGINPGDYSGGIYTDLSKPFPPAPPDPALADIHARMQAARQAGDGQQRNQALEEERAAVNRFQPIEALNRWQGDWAARVENNGKLTGVYTDYHYFGTGDIGGTPDENSVKLLEAIVTKGTASLPKPESMGYDRQPEMGPPVQVGDGPVKVISSNADQMFLDITPSEAAGLPRYTGEMELTNHSAGSLTSQAYQKRWIRKEELLADAAEKASLAAEWLGARPYPMARLNDAWTLVMGGHFHDIAAGTATPRAYEFAWNDDVIAMNQFAGVLKDATTAVAAGMNTEAKGVPIVVYNPLNIAREDVVEAAVDFPGGRPGAVRVTGPDGQEVPSQISEGKVLFVAKAPSVGYAVYDVQPATGGTTESGGVAVTPRSLENQYYRVTLNDDGDIAGIFDKSINKELLASPARLAISYDNPRQWPAWNMDWDQEQAPPRAYVGGSARIRVVENGPVRAAIEISRETAGSVFVQTVRLSAGDAGRRVEIGNVIDWNTRESNLKAVFPLTASDLMATYNWDIGTIRRPTAEPKKFEVPSHQWIDLTDADGEFGATVLTDCKNGSDKPNDHTIRLTLIRTPGIRGGYPDQATQDIGHHEFVYGIAGHRGDWRDSGTDWQAERLNQPLIAFQTSAHAGALGREFSLLKVSNPRVRVMALKKAELSDELILRLVELDGRPEPDVRISFAAPISAAREVNGQEQPVGPASVSDGALVTSFSAYQPRTFALKLGAASATVAGVRSMPVPLHYDLAAATNDGAKSAAGFDGKGNALPAEMLPEQITFDDVQFHLAPAKTGVPDAVVARGQTISLPAGSWNRVYLVAAAMGGDQKASFETGNARHELNIEDWGGFIGQWDDREWANGGPPPGSDSYGEMVGLKPGYIKRADLAWYCSHHHNPEGVNVPYRYSYLFAYSMDLPSGARTLRLPNNDKIRVLAVSVAEQNPGVRPVQPLYDVLPSPDAVADFSVSPSQPEVSVWQGRTATTRINVIARNGFTEPIHLTASGLPDGVTASLDPRTHLLTLTAAPSISPTESTLTIAGNSGNLSHSATFVLRVRAVQTGTVPVDLSSSFNVTGIYTDGSKFTEAASLDGGGFSLPEQPLGRTAVWDGVTFHLGPPNAPDAVGGGTVPLPSGKFGSLKLLVTAVQGSKEPQVFTINYADGTSQSFSHSISDWAGAADTQGESVALTAPYRLIADGARDERDFHIYGISFDLDPGRALRSISLPENREVLVFAMTLAPAS